METRLALQDKTNLLDVVRASSDFETFRNLLENESSTNRLFNQASIYLIFNPGGYSTDVLYREAPPRGPTPLS